MLGKRSLKVVALEATSDWSIKLFADLSFERAFYGDRDSQYNPGRHPQQHWKTIFPRELARVAILSSLQDCATNSPLYLPSR